MGCFSLSCTQKIEVSNVHTTVADEFTSFSVPGIPHKVELTNLKLPENLDRGSEMKRAMDRYRTGDLAADGILVNSFEEFEGEYIDEYKKVKGEKVWCIGPVCGCNVVRDDMFERGQIASVSETECLEWLDLWEDETVVYACLGSICGLKSWQLMELGLGLEESNKPFIWVIGFGGGEEKIDDLKRWVEEDNGFGERIRGRGFLIWGWAPQVFLLSHPAVGAFLTHCGWNSVLEGVNHY